MYMLLRRMKRPSWWVAVAVGVHGGVLIGQALLRQFHASRLAGGHDFDIIIDAPLLLSLVLLQLSLLLARRKRNAWLCAMATYLFWLGLNTAPLLSSIHSGFSWPRIVSVALPTTVLLALWVTRRDFVVQSDLRTFASSVRVVVLVLVATFLYGTAGFLLMEHRDFHQELSLAGAMHYTIDQFSLTTDPLHAYTRRAAIFQGSLTFVSISAVAFAFLSFFQPLRARYGHHRADAARARELIRRFPADSEDFFKLWPEDKMYLFAGNAAIAYKVRRGVALAVGDPFGDPAAVPEVIERFEELCFVNDWRPAFIHATPRFKTLFEHRGYHMQPIGEEALVDVAAFAATAAQRKYFREIRNRFTKLGFTTELLQPPHQAAVLERLHTISDEWLQKPGRTERGFMMGYFEISYLQRCPIMVAHDAAGTIQAFINLLPATKPGEANYDLLRASQRAPGNSSDYLLLELLAQLQRDSAITRLNLGLSPLAGLDDAPDTLLNRTLRLVYAGSDRFYSFRGLHRFKAKYEPIWEDRYAVYQGGAADFSRIMRALVQAMKP